MSTTFRQSYSPELTASLRRACASPDESAFRAVADSGEIGVLTELLDLLWEDDKHARLAALTIDALLARLDVDDLAVVDYGLRESCRINHQGSRWSKLSVDPPKEWNLLDFFRRKDPGRTAPLSRLSDFPEFSPRLYGIASIHPNGHVREAAVRWLDQHETGIEIPFLMLRLHDWVDPVRHAAFAAFERRADEAHADELCRNWPLIERLRGRRADGELRELLRRLESIVGGHLDGEGFSALLTAKQPRIRRLAYRLALASSTRDRDRFLASAFEDSDTTIRLHALSEIRSDPQQASHLVHLIRLLGDPDGRLRAGSLRLLCDLEPPLAEQRLVAALLDRHPAVRAVARDRLPAIRPFDFRAFYRDRLAVNPPRALEGLAEVGKPEDTAEVLPYLERPEPAIRSRALKAVGRLAPTEFLECLVGGLADPEPACRRQAMNALLALKRGIPEADIGQVMRDAKEFIARKMALRLLTGLDAWRSLRWIFEAVVDSDPKFSNLGVSLLSGWIKSTRHGHLTPSRELMLDLAHRLPQVLIQLGPDQRGKIEFAVQRALQRAEH